MRLVKACLLALPLLSASPALAEVCQDPPDRVRAYLKASPEWRILRDEDLGLYRAGDYESHCPGMAVMDMDGKGGFYFGLALLRQRGGERFEKIVLLSPAGTAPAEWLVEKEFKLGRPQDAVVVIEAGPPGRYTDFGVHDKDWNYGSIRMPNWVLRVTSKGPDTTETYYIKNGKLVKFINSG